MSTGGVIFGCPDCGGEPRKTESHYTPWEAIAIYQCDCGATIELLTNLRVRNHGNRHRPFDPDKVRARAYDGLYPPAAISDNTTAVPAGAP